jgi:hypothetical protein
MSDFGEQKPKKSGCLRAFLIFLLIVGLLIGISYIILPQLISSALSGGIISRLLPKEIQNNTQILRNSIADNFDQLDKFGLSTGETVKIVSSLDLETFEKCLADIQQSQISNSSELLDKVAEYIDLSAANLNMIKKEYYTEFHEGELDKIITNFRKGPGMKKSSFRLMKETIIELMKSVNPEDK